MSADIVASTIRQVIVNSTCYSPVRHWWPRGTNGSRHPILHTSLIHFYYANLVLTSKSGSPDPVKFVFTFMLNFVVVLDETVTCIYDSAYWLS